MKRRIFVLTIICGITLFCACSNATRQNEDKLAGAEKKILQQDDGTISLKVDKADFYSDMVNPSSNTAEWNVVVSKSGRFNVWLSSATIDTTNLKYQNSVMLSFSDNRLEGRPGIDKVFRNSTDVTYPYFRADSYMGSLYIQDTGLYTVQVISDKVVHSIKEPSPQSKAYDTKLLSVKLVPITK